MRVAALTLDVFFLIGLALMISLFFAEKKRKHLPTSPHTEIVDMAN
jgi:UMF1 family MFS transporter